MILVSLFIASNLFIPNNYRTIIQLLRISMHVKYFSNSYVICTSHNNDIYKELKKRKINELEEEFNEFIKFKLNKSKEEELKSTTDIKNNKIEYLTSYSSLFQETEVYSENSLESNHQLEALDLSVSSCLLPKQEVNSKISSESNNQVESSDLLSSSYLLPELKVHSKNFSDNNQPEIIELSDSSCMSLEPEMQSQISSKNNQPKRISIDNNNTEEYINNYEAILKYLKIKTNFNSGTILRDFKETIRNYESNKSLINKKELIIAKIEEILKKIIEKCISIIDCRNESYSKLLIEICESSKKALDIEFNKIRSFYELLLDINFEDDYSKNKKKVIMKLKDALLLKTKDFDEMEINIKKIFNDKKKYFEKSSFINFLHHFFNKEEYFLLRLFKGSYKSGYSAYKLFLKKDTLKIRDIMEIIKFYKDDKLFLVFRNVSISCLNKFLKDFVVEKKNSRYLQFI